MKRFAITLVGILSTMLSIAQTYTTVYTKGGRTIEALIREEASEAEITDMNVNAQETYPNALVLSCSSYTYNCHAYAWHMTDGGDAYWINHYTTTGATNSNISKYWVDDYYWPCTESAAVKVFYPNGDHSAVVSTTAGKYDSKWGSWPLMRHDPGYGPYTNMNVRNYYNHVTHFGALSCSNGTGITSIGVSSDYSIPSSFPSAAVVKWEVLDGKGEDAVESGKAVISSQSSTSITVSFNQMGLFEIYYYGSTSQGYQKGVASFQPIVE